MGAINRTSGPGHVLGWNFYVSTTSILQSNGVPFAMMGIQPFHWQMWWASADPLIRGWQKMDLGDATADIGKWIHWVLEIGTSQVRVFRNGLLATASIDVLDVDGVSVDMADNGFVGNPASITLATRDYCPLYDYEVGACPSGPPSCCLTDAHRPVSPSVARRTLTCSPALPASVVVSLAWVSTMACSPLRSSPRWWPSARSPPTMLLFK